MGSPGEGGGGWCDEETRARQKKFDRFIFVDYLLFLSPHPYLRRVLFHGELRGYNLGSEAHYYILGLVGLALSADSAACSCG